VTGGSYRLELASRRAFPPGRYELIAADAGQRRAMLLEGHTVRGVVDGWLEIASDGEEMVATVSGQIRHRDSGPITDECRWK
jgi:hypothetical protein